MDIFEKEQRIEAIRGIVKVRWFNIGIIVILGLVLKIKFFMGEWAVIFDYFKIMGMGIFAFGYNFGYWFFIRRPIEKIGDRSLAVIAALQVIWDQVMYTLVFYFSGTVESIAFILYFITILIASSLYKTKGIILAGLLAVVFHNGVLIAELKGLIPHITGYPGTVWFGNPFMTRGKIIGFIFYMAVAVLFSAFLSGLFRKREKKLREQRNELFAKTQALTQLKEKLEESRGVLEIKVEARIRELKELTQSLEEKVKERTKELQGKIEEMEKFNRLAVGRELKMIELKKEIAKLKDQLRNKKPDS